MKPNEIYPFSFTPNLFGRTHFWAIIQINNKSIHLPLYNGGAPKSDNIFHIREDGIFLGLEFFQGR